ncbi:hypothetical protein [Roseibium sp. TrichSKD4]|uniref:hypothetical protein n=1 Tax=Roseibium sp. TrichSKD4 TaxID=744980 RepID=UPI00058FBDF4|nr:hypothetical protein [Roseibium sp. TrichSKD4]
MLKRYASVVLALLLAACQSSTKPTTPETTQPTLTVPQGAQSVNIAADPQTVRTALVTSANERGTKVVQNSANMVVMERVMAGDNPALDQEFGPSNNGNRVIRIRVRFTGAACNTFAVQELAVINNASTALEQSFVLPGNANTQDSLNGLKSRAEQSSSCPRIG